jgi:hypothetical protein
MRCTRRRFHGTQHQQSVFSRSLDTDMYLMFKAVTRALSLREKKPSHTSSYFSAAHILRATNKTRCFLRSLRPLCHAKTPKPLCPLRARYKFRSRTRTSVGQHSSLPFHLKNRRRNGSVVLASGDHLLLSVFLSFSLRLRAA